MASSLSPAELRAFEPDWWIFFGRSVSPAQLAIWLPYLRRSRFRYAVMSSIDVVPDAARTALAGLANCAIVEPFVDARAELRSCPGFRGVIYLGGRPDNFRMVNGFPRSAHVWLGHGESDKQANAFRTASLYDSVFTARYRGVRRFPRAVRPWVWIGALAIGAPIVEGARKEPWTRPRPVRTILYAPTWEGHRPSVDYSSLPEVAPAITAALPGLTARGVKVVVRPHPANGSRVPEYRSLVDAMLAAGAVRGGDKGADFGAADVLIGDISGLTSEFLFTEKPTILPGSERLDAIGRDERRLRAEYPWTDRWRPEREDLLEVIGRLEARDALCSARARAARDMFHGHESLEDAVRSFDLALSTVRWRKAGWIPLRFLYEPRRFLMRLRSRPRGEAAQASNAAPPAGARDQGEVEGEW